MFEAIIVLVGYLALHFSIKYFRAYTAKALSPFATVLILGVVVAVMAPYGFTVFKYASHQAKTGYSNPDHDSMTTNPATSGGPAGIASNNVSMNDPHAKGDYGNWPLITEQGPSSDGKAYQAPSPQASADEKEEELWPKSLSWFRIFKIAIFLTVAFMGVVINALIPHFKAKGAAKRNGTAPPPFIYEDILVPMLMSLLVIVTLIDGHSHDPLTIHSLAFAFQNGFCWEALFKATKA